MNRKETAPVSEGRRAATGGEIVSAFPHRRNPCELVTLGEQKPVRLRAKLSETDPVAVRRSVAREHLRLIKIALKRAIRLCFFARAERSNIIVGELDVVRTQLEPPRLGTLTTRTVSQSGWKVKAFA